MLRCISVFFVVFICWACEVDYSVSYTHLTLPTIA